MFDSGQSDLDLWQVALTMASKYALIPLCLMCALAQSFHLWVVLVVWWVVLKTMPRRSSQEPQIPWHTNARFVHVCLLHVHVVASLNTYCMLSYRCTFSTSEFAYWINRGCLKGFDPKIQDGICPGMPTFTVYVCLYCIYAYWMHPSPTMPVVWQSHDMNLTFQYCILEMWLKFLRMFGTSCF